MKIADRLTSKFVLLIAAAVLTCGAAYGQEDEGNTKTKQAQAVSKEVYDRIQKAQEQVDAKNYDEALKIVQALRSKDSLTEYERQNVLNYLGFIYYNMDRIQDAMKTYEEMLKIPSMEEQIRKQTVYTLAQLNTMEENYARAVQLLDQYFTLEANPAPDPYILYAQNLYQLNRYADMIKPVEKAMEIARNRDQQVKEDWYVLLNFAYYQQEDYKKVRDIQKILLVNWPKKRYWFSLAGAYTELGEEENLVYAYDAAHTQGLLDRESELVTMAQLFMQAEVPYKAAMLLDGEMKKGTVAKDAKNYRLLAQAWTLAQEDEKSIPALQEAARLGEEGELFVRLANAHLSLGNYGECVTAAKGGIDKGDLKSVDNAQITLGMCLYNQKKYQDAIAAFRDAAKANRSERIARQWISVIEADIAREEQIRLAEAAARKQADELAKRRARQERI